MRGPDSGAVVELALGGGHGCARDGSGAVRCWGEFVSGQLGDGTFVPSSAITSVLGKTGPVATGIEDALQIAAGNEHGCAIIADRSVVCWGANDHGEIGDGTHIGPRTHPTAVRGLRDVRAIAAGSRYTCAILADRTVSCWGAGSWGRFSDGHDALTPRSIAGLSRIAAIALGRQHACALRDDGQVLCWGANERFQLGAVGPYERSAPLAVPGLSNVARVAAGARHSCVLTTDRTVLCWGDDEHGQLGDGAPRSRRADPVAVTFPGPGEPVARAPRAARPVAVVSYP